MNADESGRVAEEMERQRQRIAKRKALQLENFQRLAEDPEIVRCFYEVNREAVDSFNQLAEQFVKYAKRSLTPE